MSGFSPVQERGLIGLVAIAIVITGLVFYLPALRHPRVPAVAPIVVDNVRVIIPEFLSSLPKVDINRAGADELTHLPGIGKTLASRIIAYRDEHGPFARLEDLKKVSGIGDKVIGQIRDRVVTVSNKER